MWSDLCANTTRKDGYVRLDAFAWLNKVTLDIMGIAGFGYVIDSLHAPDDHPNELNEAVRVIASAELDVATIIQLTITALGSLVRAFPFIISHIILMSGVSAYCPRTRHPQSQRHDPRDRHEARQGEEGCRSRCSGWRRCACTREERLCRERSVGVAYQGEYVERYTGACEVD